MQHTAAQKKEYLTNLKDLIASQREFDIIEFFSELHPVDIAELIDNLDEQETVRLFSLLDVEKASDVILELSDASREQILGDISNKKLTEIIDEMESDDAADFIAALSDEKARLVLDGIEPEESEDIKELLKYEDDTAGGIMQSELITVNEDATINDALKAVAAASDDIEHAYNVFVVDAEDHLVGTVSLQQLITAKRTSKIVDSIDDDIPHVLPDVDQEEVAHIFGRYDLVSLPVIDHDGHLIGRITIDDIIDVMEEETSEDIYRIAGLDEDDSVLNKPLTSIRKRLPWLFLNLLTTLISVIVIGFFEDTIQVMVVLAVFMPVVAALGGNAGSQTLTLIVRGLAVGEVNYGNLRKAFVRQVVVGIANGIVVGTLIGLVAFLWKGTPFLGIILGLAMIINIFVGTLVGTLIPLSLKIFRLDPALGSHIFLTAFTDAFGFLSFLGLATLFLKTLS